MMLLNRVFIQRSLLLSLSALAVTTIIAHPGQAQAPAAAPPAPAATPAVLTGEAATVDATTRQWIATVTSGKATVVDDVLALYSDDAVLLATVSEQIRDTKTELRDYFTFFTALPKLSAKDYNPSIRVYDDIAINSGYYTFMYEPEPGTVKEVPARYTFTYRKINGKWMIVDHHSSGIPTAPAGLPPAN
jgi:uncharacterized protein (TIGR02246 family)